jgi:dihydroorotate dehydrogenase (NAD+) catalytic subunit
MTVGSISNCSVQVGDVKLAHPILTASGTAGYGAELDAYFSLSEIGGVVAKSVAPFAWAGNPAPRLAPTKNGMLNAVGLQGDGIEHFVNEDLVALEKSGATIIVSIWGHSVDDYLLAAKLLVEIKNRVAAIEVNLSCPNLGGDHVVFAHDARLSAQIIEGCVNSGLPIWAKLSPNTHELVNIARAVHQAGAQAVTLVNTAMGMAIDTETGLPSLGNIRGGLSGSALHPIAVRCVFDVRHALPEIGIIGVGGVLSGRDAAELMLAGANAVQVGTASFANPRAALLIQNELVDWAVSHQITDWSQVTSASHRNGLVSTHK